MKIVGLTGGIATGKSTVSQLFRDQGIDVLDADIFAREVVAEGTFGISAIAHYFGPEVLNNDHTLNRQKLKSEIFNKPELRAVLENITHPLIQLRAREEIRALKMLGRSLVLYDAALIYEKGLEKNFNAVIVVTTDTKSQLERLMARDSISKETAQSIMNSQWPLEKKVSLANIVIDNNGSKENTKKQVQEIAAKLLS